MEEFDEIMDLLQNQEHTFSVDVSENSMHDSITNALANNIICENNTRNSPYVPVHDFPDDDDDDDDTCLLYTSPSPRDRTRSRMPSSA